MNDKQDQVTLEQTLLRYLHDDLDAVEHRRFEEELEVNPDLRRMLAEERALDDLLPRGTRPVVDAERLRANRAAVQRRVYGQQKAAVRHALPWTRRLFPQAAALVLVFGLGFVAGDGAPAPSAPDASDPPSLLDLVGAQDVEVYDMRINGFDVDDGGIDITFALVAETRFVGNVSDGGVLMLIDAALRDDVDDEARLDSVEVLQRVAALRARSRVADPVPEGLVHALANDSNPGVRYTAAATLVNYVEHESVRGALRRALQEDINPGVRMLAFEALAKSPDSGTLTVFRQRMEEDGSDYIRNRARFVVSEVDSSPIIN